MRIKDNSKIDIIFSATIQLVEEIGISGLKMSNIAKQSGYSTGTLYIYFKNKEELLNALYIKLKTKTFHDITEGVDNHNIEKKLFNIWKNVLDFRLNNHGDSIFMEQFLISPFINEEAKNIENISTQFILNVLEEGKKQGIINDISNEILVSMLSGYSKEYCKYLYNNAQKIDNETLDISFSLCWNAIKKQP